jgi:hypothetical protein
MRLIRVFVVLLISFCGSFNAYAIDAYEDLTNEPYVILEGISFAVGEELVILEVSTKDRLDVFIDSIVPFGQDLQIEVTERHAGRHIILNIPYNP